MTKVVGPKERQLRALRELAAKQRAVMKTKVKAIGGKVTKVKVATTATRRGR